MMVNFEFPLQWLPQQPRTSARAWARFGNHSVSGAGDRLVGALTRLGAKHIVVSSNLQTRARGDGFLSHCWVCVREVPHPSGVGMGGNEFSGCIDEVLGDD